MNKIAVLLSTFNGEKYLEEQLISLKNQTIPFDLYIRDDGSKDRTLEILTVWQGKINFKFIKGNNIGVSKSFFELLCLPELKNEFIAFCDQDDIWHPNKLEEGISKMDSININSLPCLYHSNLNLIDDIGNSLNLNFWYSMNIIPELSHSLNRLVCQPIVTGCSSMINQSLRETYLYYPNPNNVKMHDWWISLLACCFGKIISDENIYINYRIHSNNVIGAETNKIAKLTKAIMNLKIYCRNWKNENFSRIKQAEELFKAYNAKLKYSNHFILKNFISLLELSFFQRKIIQYKFKFHQHGILRNIIAFFLF
jgi:glycosyltransferase involved in cell wall biosynthesis